MTSLRAKGVELQDAIASLESTVRELAGRETELRTQLSASEEELKSRRAGAQSAQERRSNLQITMARLESDLKHLEEMCQTELQVAVSELARKISKRFLVKRNSPIWIRSTRKCAARLKLWDR